jgi:hypothetical protein
MTAMRRRDRAAGSVAGHRRSRLRQDAHPDVSGCLPARERRPRNILLLTFTNKAARQMLDRVANLLPTDASGSGAGRFIPSATGCCAATAALSDIRAVSPSWIAKTEGFAQLCGRGQRNRSKEIRFPKGDVGRHLQFRCQHGTTDLNCSRKSFLFPAAVEQIKDVQARYERRKNRPTRSISMICSKSPNAQGTRGDRGLYRRQFNSSRG